MIKKLFLDEFKKYLLKSHDLVYEREKEKG